MPAERGDEEVAQCASARAGADMAVECAKAQGFRERWAEVPWLCKGRAWAVATSQARHVDTPVAEASAVGR